MITRRKLAEAVERNEPFAISLADGKDYSVPHRDYISIAPHHEYFVVHNDEGFAHVLPIPLVTAISYRDPSQAIQSAR